LKRQRHRDRLRLGLIVVLGLAVPAGCNRQPLPAPQARYMVGEPYSLGDLWSYPREDFALVETGLASTLPDRRAGRRTSNGEVFDPARLVGAHRTLQLPVILRVRNLDTGREIRLRVNDRGPVQPGRILGLSERAATLLGGTSGDAIPVRIEVDEAPSRALARGLPNQETAALAIAAAPRGAVRAEALAPPPGARIAARGPAPAPRAEGQPAAEAAAPLPPDPLPEEVIQGHAQPGRLFIETGVFFRHDQAQRQAARIAGARVEAVGSGRQAQFRVRLGPFADAAAADRTLAQVLRAGVADPRILID
jgi:rare lipoprotein A